MTSPAPPKTSAAPTVRAALAAAVRSLDGEHREGQLAMAEAVAATLAGGDHLLVQAGTGTGKSLAYLVPAMLHAAAHRERVVVATATLALQHQLVSRDLPRAADALEPVLGERPTYAVLKGRHNYLCLDRLHRGAADDDQAALFAAPSTALGRQAAQLREWADDSETGDRDDVPFPVDGRVWRAVSVSGRECVGAQKCAYGAECFAERAREVAKASQLVVTNHAMLAIHALDQVPVLPEHDAVVVDEGHELVDRATQAVSRELAAAMVERAAQRAHRYLSDDAQDRLETAAEELAEQLDTLEPGARILAPDTGLRAALTAVRDGARGALQEFANPQNRERAKDDPQDAAAQQRAKGLLSEVIDVAEKVLALDESHVAWVEAAERRPAVLHLAPLSVAGVLREALFDEVPVVVTSATLTLGGSFRPIAGSYGLTVPPSPRGAPAAESGPGWRGLDVGSPFDHARQGILYVPKQIPAPGRDGVSEQALDELAALIGSAGGRTLALFSSWRGVERAAAHLAEKLPDELLDREIVPTDAPVLVQQRGDSVADLVRRFATEPRSVLLGTLSLWQGVDVPGSSCNLVVIDRIPFPRPNEPLTRARSDAADAAGGSGFAEVSVPRAALMLAQGVGRLIRSGQDRGVVAVLDSRLATMRYGTFLRASLPPFWYTNDGAAVRGALARLDELAG